VVAKVLSHFITATKVNGVAMSISAIPLQKRQKRKYGFGCVGWKLCLPGVRTTRT